MPRVVPAPADRRYSLSLRTLRQQGITPEMVRDLMKAEHVAAGVLEGKVIGVRSEGLKGDDQVTR